jgi:bifunctional non-homologous end joining protein LigD
LLGNDICNYLATRRQKTVRQEEQTAKVFTRRGNDWTNRFKEIAANAYLINAACATIDGEIVVPAADGPSDFSVLQNELRGKSTKS